MISFNFLFFTFTNKKKRQQTTHPNNFQELDGILWIEINSLDHKIIARSEYEMEKNYENQRQMIKLKNKVSGKSSFNHFLNFSFQVSESVLVIIKMDPFKKIYRSRHQNLQLINRNSHAWGISFSYVTFSSDDQTLISWSDDNSMMIFDFWNFKTPIFETHLDNFGLFDAIYSLYDSLIVVGTVEPSDEWTSSYSVFGFQIFFEEVYQMLLFFEDQSIDLEWNTQSNHRRMCKWRYTGVV